MSGIQTLPTDAPPAWVARRIAGARTSCVEVSGAAPLRVACADEVTLLSAAIPGAINAPADTLRDAVAACYDAIAEQVAAEGHHPIRFWNFIPSLHGPMAPGIDRYMVFNSGRYLVYARRLGGLDAFARAVPTATGVGSRASDLTIHCLAAAAPGRPVDNPRQVPAYRYSTRYGPHPPSFARATLVADGRQLLVGGTASVCGEDSVHIGDLDRQIDETLVNLASLVHSADRACGREPASQDAALARFCELRAYLPVADHAPRVLAAIRSGFPRVRDIEVIDADLCRAELLVELEGVVRMDASPSAR